MKKNIFLCLFIAAATYMFSPSVNAQVTIGSGVDPDNSAVLDLQSGGNKGLLLPRVALTSHTDATTIPNPAVGLMVYNLGTEPGFNTPGCYFWNGTEWYKFESGTGITPSIDALKCEDASISPIILAAGIAYNGILRVPYTGGNGGMYPGGMSIQSTGNTGLTATLQGGTLADGDGELIFTLRGIPSASSPIDAAFALNFLGKTCTVTVSGDMFVGESQNHMCTMPDSPTGTLLSSLYPGKIPTIDGLMMDLVWVNNNTYSPRIYNVSSDPIIISYHTPASMVSEKDKIELNLTLNPGDFVNVVYKDISNWSTTSAEVETANLQIQIGPNEWRWYELKWWAMETQSNPTVKTVFMSMVRKA